MNAIETHNLRKEYPGFVLDGLNLTLPSGTILGLIGENGAGKSTTMKLLLGMIRPDGGSFTLLGQSEPDMEDIGVVLDEPGFPLCFNAKQLGKVMAGIYRRWDPAVYVGLLTRFRLPENKKYSDLSRGMKMKLAIAVAMSHHPKLLILDEATNGLDPIVRDEILDLFNEFTRQADHSILISSHIVSDLEKYNGGAFPKNDNRKYQYSRTVFSGIVSSVNAVAVHTLDRIGFEYSYNFGVENFGLTTLVRSYILNSGKELSDLGYSPLALGALTVGCSVRDMSNAYATFANNGVWREGRTFTKV